MKNKIIYTSLASAIVILGLIGITNAGFGSLSSENRESHRVVMDKLIDGEALTAEDKVVLAEIKTQRAEGETLRAKREAQRVELAPILEKVKAGTDLTAEEQTKLDAFKAEGKGRMGNFSKSGKGGNRGGGFGGGCPFHD